MITTNTSRPNFSQKSHFNPQTSLNSEQEFYIKLATWMDKSIIETRMDKSIIETRTKVFHKNVSQAKISESRSFLVRYKGTYILKKMDFNVNGQRFFLLFFNIVLFCQRNNIQIQRFKTFYCLFNNTFIRKVKI